MSWNATTASNIQAIIYYNWKEPEVIKILKKFPVSLKTAITTSEAIFTAGVTQKEALMLYQGVHRPKVEYPLG